MIVLKFPTIFCPGWWITRLPLSPETQELNHKRQIPPINTVISYRNIQGVTNGVTEGRVPGAMSHFIPKTRGMKADISASVWRLRVSVEGRTIGHFYLLALMLKRLMEVQGQPRHRGVG